MARQGWTTVTVALEQGSEPISGWVDVDGSRRRRFSGWLDLVAEIESLRDRPPAAGDPAGSLDALGDGAGRGPHAT